MKFGKISLFSVLFAQVLGSPVIFGEEANAVEVQAARAAANEFFEAFLSRDIDEWISTYHFPHVRFTRDSVAIWEKPENVKMDFDFDRFISENEWHHSVINKLENVQSSDTKAHFIVRFTHYRKDNSVIGVYDSFWIVTKHGGRWGVQGRSTFVP